eukprot:1403876-Rhodomonas_salina.1
MRTRVSSGAAAVFLLGIVFGAGEHGYAAPTAKVRIETANSLSGTDLSSGGTSASARSAHRRRGIFQSSRP